MSFQVRIQKSLLPTSSNPTQLIIAIKYSEFTGNKNVIFPNFKYCLIYLKNIQNKY